MWKNRNVWILLSGEFIAGLGLWLGIIGNLEFMQAKLPSDFLKSLLLAGGLLAGVAVGPYAGRLTDQTSKKTVMLIAGFVRTISVIFMLIAIHTGSIWWMALFLVLLQVSAAFYFPALQAALPLIVAEKDLLQLNGVHMNVSTLSRIIGTALAGVLLVILPLSMLYIGSLVGYIGLFILTWFLNFNESKQSKLEKHEKVKNSSVENSSFKDIFPIIKNLPIVYMTLIMTLVPVLFLGGFNLLVINISELQHSSAIKGWIYTAEGISFMLGAFFIKLITDRVSPYIILFICSFMIGVSQLLLYLANVPLLSVLAFALFGFSVGCFFPTAATIFQTKVPKDYHGRFFSFRNMLDRISFQIVLLISGFLLDLIGLQLMCVLFGAISIITTTIFYARHKRVQMVEQKN
ncbi:DHA3 family macrolide efflux protein-like MFS transporter [Bacillus sp. SORGH_AS 510]|uniref:MFS transporter n=1 Tax=Bacillus sp. SORGH_AS_0510 TaxID=3041771 RepID=UPI00278145F6|nr:MFS transporter [Bacillus sp. SORGH_AS_0510]MDQ1147879.1 DHA3 family macrolide efflux protein-like MFS transporter [Bacillus sp. SORGH_AS_0510]